jgi:LPS export ABC transporter protein LptC
MQRFYNSLPVSFFLRAFAPSWLKGRVMKRMLLQPVLFLVFFSAILFTGCINDPAEVNSFSKNDKLPLLTEKDVDLNISDSAKRKIHLTAPMMEEFGGINPYEEMLKGVRLEFFDEDEKMNGYLTANYAINHKREQLMEAKNNVVVVNTKGERLNTEDLIWDARKRRIHTDAFVKITTKDQVITGMGLDSDERFENYEIKNITGTILLKDVPE